MCDVFVSQEAINDAQEIFYFYYNINEFTIIALRRLKSHTTSINY